MEESTLFEYKPDRIVERRIRIGTIPCCVFTPQAQNREPGQKLPTLFYYHGWSSNKHKQRFIASIFASFGYQVLLPDAIYHGERGALENYETALYDYFMSTVMQNLAEFQTLEHYALTELSADEKRLAVSGHSMGGYTAAGIFTHNPELKTAVVFNGAFDWQNAIQETEKRYGTDHIELSAAEKNTDPACNLEKLIDRPLFMLHGEKDALVPFEVQKAFFEKLQLRYRDKSRIRFMAVERMNHYISVQMLNEALIWLSTNV